MVAKKTKIICTISDLNCDPYFLRKLYESGMNVVRINSAHASLEGAQKIVDNVRKVSDKIAILVDTKGPEIRIRSFGTKTVTLQAECTEEIGRFVPREHADFTQENEADS